MILLGGRLEATYEREIERKPINNIIFYGSLAVVISIIIFIYGIRPTVLALAQNRRYQEELQGIKTNMETKLSQIQASERVISENQPGMAGLNQAIPTDINLQEFLQELVVKSAEAGFVIQRVRQAESSGNEIEVDVDMSGQIPQIPALVGNMEGMRRFVSMNDLRFDTDGTTANVKLRVTIYKI